MTFKTGTLGCAIGALALMLAANNAQAQFFPFFQQQQQPQQQPAPQPQPQQTRPSQPTQAPVRRAQPPAQQKASAPAQKAPAGTAAVPFPEVRSACSAEIKGTCAGVAPGSAESVQCLRPNFAVHTPPCQAALQQGRQRRRTADCADRGEAGRAGRHIRNAAGRLHRPDHPARRDAGIGCPRSEAAGHAPDPGGALGKPELQGGSFAAVPGRDLRTEPGAPMPAVASLVADQLLPEGAGQALTREACYTGGISTEVGATSSPVTLAAVIKTEDTRI